MSESGEIPRVLERYRGEGKRGYPDLHDHVLALHRAGRLIVVDEPINKDTESTLWSAGSIVAALPKAIGEHSCSRKPPRAKAPATI